MGLYSAAAGKIERLPINGAVVFVAFGFLLGPFGFGLLGRDVGAPSLRLVTEIALSLVLFVEASKSDLKVIARSFAIPQRLILVALPLTILFGIGVGLMIFGELSLVGVAILAAIVAPTDAALSKAVVTDNQVPGEIREGLNFESGLNDGVCVPIFLALMAYATGAEASGPFTSIASGLLIKEVGIGSIVGLLVVGAAASVIKFCDQKGWISDSWTQVPFVATAIASFATAQFFGGSGFMAAFVGGLLLGMIAGKNTRSLVISAEGSGNVLVLLTWIAFGVEVVGQVAYAFSWRVLVFSILALTAVRMIPVAIAMTGLPLTIGERLFISWFGPRGPATIVFIMIVYQSDVAGADLIVITAACTVLLSVIVHAVSARPVISRTFIETKTAQSPHRNAL